MRHVIAEFLTTDDASPECYGDSGMRLHGLRRFPSILRHEEFDEDCWHEVDLFARDPEMFAQVWLSVYPEPGGASDFERALKSYEEERSNFRMPTGERFESEALVPRTASSFQIVPPFRVRDNRRLRIVQAFRGRHRSILLVASRNDSRFLTSAFLRAAIDGLSLADVPLDGPFARGCE